MASDHGIEESNMTIDLTTAAVNEGGRNDAATASNATTLACVQMTADETSTESKGGCIFSGCSNLDTMTDAANVAVMQTKKKRKPTDDAAGPIDAIDATDVEYVVVQSDNKRRKIEVRKKKKECQAVANENRPVKPAVPPKPKHLVCRPPPHVLNNCHSKAKHETVLLHKLTAHAEQLRQENIELKAALSNERNAVRTLRYI